jgi:ankyrin repeat protein
LTEEPCSRCQRLDLHCLARRTLTSLDQKRAISLRKEISEYILSGVTDFPTQLLSRLLLWAAENGHNRVVELLLEIGVSVDVKDPEGNTSLHLAALNCYLLVVRILLRANASISATNLQENTPLHYAATSGSKEILSALLQANAHVEAKNSSGSTPLHLASLFNNQTAVDMLLASKVDPKAEVRYGRTHLQGDALMGTNGALGDNSEAREIGRGHGQGR